MNSSPNFVLTEKREPNIWLQICAEFDKKRQAAVEYLTNSADPEYLPSPSRLPTPETEYKSDQHHPTFLQNRLFQQVVNDDILTTFDVDFSVSHPSVLGYAFIEKPHSAPPPQEEKYVDPKTCSSREYLEHHIFPFLTEALEAMLQQAKMEKCFEKRRSAFNPCDFLTMFFYRNNPRFVSRLFSIDELKDIPFVEEFWKTQPRPPLPKSLIWSEEEAALKIQSFWRGYLVRRDAEVQELRKWQAEWRDINADGHTVAKRFWAGKIPVGGEEEDQHEG